MYTRTHTHLPHIQTHTQREESLSSQKRCRVWHQGLIINVTVVDVWPTLPLSASYVWGDPSVKDSYIPYSALEVGCQLVLMYRIGSSFEASLEQRLYMHYSWQSVLTITCTAW